MIEREPDATDLIGYLTYDALSSQTTLVVCSRAGRPVRRVLLEPMGVIATFFRRLALRLGRYRRACRAITRDEQDARVFPVWIVHDRSIVVSDAIGAAWMRSSVERTTNDAHRVDVIPNAVVISVVRSFGYGDASRN